MSSIASRSKQLFVLLLALAAGGVALAQETPPDQLVKNVTEEVLAAVRMDKDIQHGNTQKTLDLVEAKVLPHFNFLRMTKLALGRDGRKATPAQIDALAEEFRTLLVRTYSKALTEYRDQKIAYKPFSMKPAETDVRVKTEIHQSGGKPVTMDYYLEKNAAAWKVYDIEVGGVSLVINYRSSFAQEIRTGGIDSLIGSLREKNRSAASTAPAK